MLANRWRRMAKIDTHKEAHAQNHRQHERLHTQDLCQHVHLHVASFSVGLCSLRVRTRGRTSHPCHVVGGADAGDAGLAVPSRRHPNGRAPQAQAIAAGQDEGLDLGEVRGVGPGEELDAFDAHGTKARRRVGEGRAVLQPTSLARKRMANRRPLVAASPPAEPREPTVISARPSLIGASSRSISEGSCWSSPSTWMAMSNPWRSA